MSRRALPTIERRPEVPWPAIIEALRVAGISTRRIGDAIALSHSTVNTWKRGAKPNFEDGAAFLALAWRERHMLPAELAAHGEPRNLDLPAYFRGGTPDERRRSVDRRRQQIDAAKPRAEISAPVGLVGDASPWSSLDSVTQLWRGVCTAPA